MSKSEGHKMVEIAVDLLGRLANDSHGLGPREISREFNISSTAAQRLVTSLERKQCLEFDELTRKYKLGLGVIRFSQGSIGKSDIIKVAKPYMEELCQYSKETICLNTTVDEKRMTIYQEESIQELRYTTEIGKLYPIYIGASGKAILAHMNEEKMKGVIENYVQEDQQLEILDELKSIREKHFSISYGERISGGVGISVPIIVGNLLFSLSIYAPNNRIDDGKVAVYIQKLQEAVRSIENQFKNVAMSK